jgi:hypothetical protein
LVNASDEKAAAECFQLTEGSRANFAPFAVINASRHISPSRELLLALPFYEQYPNR